MSFISNSNIMNLPEEPKESSSYLPFVFVLKYGESAKIVFLSSASSCPTVKLHEIWNVDKSPLRIPCMKPVGQKCPVCEISQESGDKRFSPNNMFFFSILDLRPFKKEDGTEVPFTKKFLIAKEGTVRKVIQPLYSMIVEEYEADLSGAVVRVVRSKRPSSGPPPAVCGDSMHYLKHVSLKDGEFGSQEPFTEEELEKMLLVDPNKIGEVCEKLRSSTENKVDWSSL